MHPISSNDFATAVADYAGDYTCNNKELLVGGPKQIRWRELGLLIAKRRNNVRLLTLPLQLFKLLLNFVSLLSILLPSLKGLALSMLLLMIPMTTNTSNEEFICVGSDTVEDLLNNDHRNQEQITDGWVHQKVFRRTKRNEASKCTVPSPKQLSNIVWIVAMCDGLIVFFNPKFVSRMLNLDLDSIDGILVQSFGIVSIGLAATTFASLHLTNDDQNSRMVCAVWVGLLFDLTSVIAMTFHKYNAIMLAAYILISQFLVPKNIYCQGILSLTITSFGLVNFFDPRIVLSALFETGLGRKTQQHMRQIAIWYIGSGLHKIALLIGLGSTKAAGLVCLVWCVFSVEQWRVVDMVSVFQMSSFSKTVNETFPIWSGMVAALILCRH
jgi:hypothetical protein